MFLVLCINASLAIENISWILQILQDTHLIHIDYKIFRSIMAFAWMASLLRYQTFGLLMENVVSRSFTYKFHQKCISAINMILLSYIGYLAITQFYNIEKPLFAHPGMLYIPGFLLLTLIPSFIITIIEIRKRNIPQILRIQLQTLLSSVILPHFFFDMIQFFAFIHQIKLTASANFNTVATIFLLYGLYYCARKILRFRFLNLSNHVTAIPRIDLQQSLKESIEQLSTASSLSEIKYITQNFFKDQFGVTFLHSYVHFRNDAHPCTDIKAGCKEIHATIENFIADPDTQAIDVCKQYKLFIFH
jgi:hypothetical protein